MMTESILAIAALALGWLTLSAPWVRRPGASGSEREYTQKDC